MSLPPPFDSYPASFPYHSEHPGRRYRHRPDCFALLGESPGPGKTAVLYTLPAENIVVYSGAPPMPHGLDEGSLRPVYALSEHEPPAVPSGKVFLQAVVGFPLEQRVASLGYRVESVPAHAPQAAWLVAQDHTISTALANLDDLIALDGIDSVEPQMLRPAVRRR